MPISMNDFARQWQDTSELVLAAVREVGESGWYVLGKQVAAFESALTRQLETAHVVGCASGLDALEIALRALGLTPGQKVLTTPTSAFATTLAIVRAGGVPVFVDVDESGLLDLELAAQRLAADPTIRFLLPVHLYGHAIELARLEQLALRFELTIVEDCAQAIGARSAGRPVGAVGQAAALSFYPTKNLGALGDAGALTTRDADVAAHARSLRDYGQSTRFVHEIIGLNSRLDELHAAILLRAFLPKLPAWTERRRATAQRYASALEGHRHVRKLPVPPGSESVWHLFPITVVPAQRAALQAHLQARGIPSGIHYPRTIPSQPALREVPFEVHGALTRAEMLARSELTLPLHPYLSDDEVAHVIEALGSFVAP